MRLKSTVAALSLVALTACSSNSDNNSNSNGEQTAQGSLSLNLTDAPIDEASHVYVSLSGVSLNFEDSGWVDYDFSEVQKIDLLTLQSGNTFSLLDEVEVEPGSYKVRLNIYSDDDNVPDNSIVLTEGGIEYDLEIPSGEQTGLKITTPVLVPENGNVSYTIDFDVRKSIVKRGQSHNYALKPTLRLIEDSASGHISGEITDLSLLTENCSDEDPTSHNTIYVYEGNDAIPNDIVPEEIESDGQQPLTTTPVNFNEETGIYSYTAGFIPVGDYTVALTCSSDLENLETDDELNFKDIHNVTVTVENSEQDDDSDEELDEDDAQEELDSEESNP